MDPRLQAWAGAGVAVYGVPRPAPGGWMGGWADAASYAPGQGPAGWSWTTFPMTSACLIRPAPGRWRAVAERPWKSGWSFPWRHDHRHRSRRTGGRMRRGEDS